MPIPKEFTGVVICFQISIFEPLETTPKPYGKIRP